MLKCVPYSSHILTRYNIMVTWKINIWDNVNALLNFALLLSKWLYTSSSMSDFISYLKMKLMHNSCYTIRIEIK
jgi:hypothetical protein